MICYLKNAILRSLIGNYHKRDCANKFDKNDYSATEPLRP